MAGQRKTTTAAKRQPPPAPKPADDRDNLSVAKLARGILSKEIRARATDVRRLAEALLAGASAKPKKDKKGKAGGGKKMDKGKNKKLPKIPGQKAKK